VLITIKTELPGHILPFALMT